MSSPDIIDSPGFKGGMAALEVGIAGVILLGALVKHRGGWRNVLHKPRRAALSDKWIEARLPVWSALSALFFYPEPPPGTHAQIKEARYRAGFSRDEVRDMLWNEVYPAFALEPLDVAGRRTLWTGDEVRQRVGKVVQRPEWMRWMKPKPDAGRLAQMWTPMQAQEALGSVAADGEERREAHWKELLRRFRRYGGVLQFERFGSIATSDRDEILRCVREALESFGPVDAGALAKLPFRRLTEEQFLGSWYDPGTGSPVVRGSGGATAAGDVPKKGDAVAMPGPRGQFSNAFANPPYGMYGATRAAVQELFFDMRQMFLSPGERHEIEDYSGPELVAVSSFFEDGTEWWGSYLWTIYTPSTQSLWVVFASATD